jgi:C4-dicarboxylate-specific signal transduction histidine kinase
VGASLGLSLLVFLACIDSLGVLAGGVALVPSIAAAMLFDSRTAVAVGIVSCALMNGAMWLTERPPWPTTIMVAGTGCVVGLSLLVGRLHDFQERTAQAERERELALARSRLSDAERLVSLGTLAAGIAHEVNNPLAFIAANLRYLKEAIENPDENHDEMRRAILESEAGAERVQAIVATMKRLARDGTAEPGVTDFKQTVTNVLQLLHGSDVPRARLTTSFLPSPSVQASEAQLGQVVLNLVTNALQCFPKPSLENTVSIRVGTDDQGWALLEIGDNGPGISAAVRKRMFDPFFTTKPPGVGTGLGLPVCKSVVEALGGTLSFETKVDRGTIFRVAIPPEAPRHESPVPFASEAFRSSDSTAPAPP